jgi:DNA mismatch endonuclease, patch repair protein
MSLVRSKNTSPELFVRRHLHSKGLRYRLHASIEGIRPDMVFAGLRAAVWVHGCMWHRHQDPSCKLTRMPKSREEFWRTKFAQNVARDTRQRKILEERGWRVFVVWECQIRLPAVLHGLERSLKKLRTAGGLASASTDKH